MKNYYKRGSNNVICARCGNKYKAEQVTYDGYLKKLIVCYKCYDPFPEAELPQKIYKHEMDPPHFINTAPTPVFIETTLVWGKTFLTWGSTYRSWGDSE
jgi:NAD-dependent SIR2 family protein deacetylase